MPSASPLRRGVGEGLKVELLDEVASVEVFLWGKHAALKVSAGEVVAIKGCVGGNRGAFNVNEAAAIMVNPVGDRSDALKTWCGQAGDAGPRTPKRMKIMDLKDAETESRGTVEAKVERDFLHQGHNRDVLWLQCQRGDRGGGQPNRR